MIRFLHISDVHINKTFATKDEKKREQRQRHIVKSFQRAIGLCVEKHLDALVISGDLFDHHQISFKDQYTIIEGFKKLDQYDIKVLYASGNHDFTDYDSEIRTLAFPENVYTFFDDEYKMVPLLDTDSGQIVQFVGCGHVKAHETRNLIEKFPEGPHVGIVHTMIASPMTIGDEGQYLPSTVKTIDDKGYRYFALGHIHKNGSVNKDETAYYAGCLQGLNPNETGAKGGYLVTLDQDQTHVEFVSLAEIIYEKQDLDVSECKTFDQLVDLCLLKLNTVDHANSKIVTLFLEGRSDLYMHIKEKDLVNLKEIILEQLPLYDLILKSKLRMSVNQEEFKLRKSVLGSVLNALDDLDVLPDLEYLSKDTVSTEGLADRIMAYFLEDQNEN